MLPALLLLLGLAGAEPPEPPPAPSVTASASLSSDAELRRRRQAAAARTAGVVAGLSGPPALAAGFFVTLLGFAGDEEGLVAGGLALGTAGFVATALGTPVTLAGRARAASVLRRRGEPVSPALPIAAGVAHGLSIPLVIAGLFNADALPAVIPGAALYLTGVGLSWGSANGALGRIRGPRAAVHPGLVARGAPGMTVSVVLGGPPSRGR
jgi:hypothetical protein